MRPVTAPRTRTCERSEYTRPTSPAPARGGCTERTPPGATGGAALAGALGVTGGGVDTCVGARADLTAARFSPQQPIVVTSRGMPRPHRCSSRSLQMQTAHGSDHAWWHGTGDELRVLSFA